VDSRFDDDDADNDPLIREMIETAQKAKDRIIELNFASGRAMKFKKRLADEAELNHWTPEEHAMMKKVLKWWSEAMRGEYDD
jgi:hypothetical protein